MMLTQRLPSHANPEPQGVESVPMHSRQVVLAPSQRPCRVVGGSRQICAAGAARGGASQPCASEQLGSSQLPEATVQVSLTSVLPLQLRAVRPLPLATQRAAAVEAVPAALHSRS